MSDFREYVSYRRDHLLELTLEHAQLVLFTIVTATGVAVAIAVLVYRHERVASGALAGAGALFTVPSLALFALMMPIFGLGFRPAFVALVIYALLPIMRNTIVGLRSVDSAVTESAEGMGMNRLQRLVRIELPLAWPVIITGIRVSTIMTVGIAAIAAYINGPGLGGDIIEGLARIGSPVALHMVLAAIIGVVALALLFDLFYLAVGKLTTPRGIR